MEKGKIDDLVWLDEDFEMDIGNIWYTETVSKKGVGFYSKAIFGSVKGRVVFNYNRRNHNTSDTINITMETVRGELFVE